MTCRPVTGRCSPCRARWQTSFTRSPKPEHRASSRRRKKRTSLPAGKIRAAITDDPDQLQRFIDAQDAASTYQHALSQLRAGRKTSHWMWFIFPQIAGLGHSPTAVAYAIGSLAQARAYIAHPVLGPRLLQCTRTLTEITPASAVEIFGDVDAKKLRSSMTLFAHAAPHEPLFGQVLDRYFGGVADAATEKLL